MFETRTQRRLKVLLRDFGLRFTDNRLYYTGKHSFGITSPTHRQFQDILGAVEAAIPILSNEEFSQRYRDIMNSKKE